MRQFHCIIITGAYYVVYHGGINPYIDPSGSGRQCVVYTSQEGLVTILSLSGGCMWCLWWVHVKCRYVLFWNHSRLVRESIGWEEWLEVL